MRFTRVATGKGYFRYRDSVTGHFAPKELWSKERSIEKDFPEWDVEKLLDKNIKEFNKLLERINEIYYGEGSEVEYGDIMDIVYVPRK